MGDEGQTKECPECGRKTDRNAFSCGRCGHRFAGHRKVNPSFIAGVAFYVGAGLVAVDTVLSLMFFTGQFLVYALIGNAVMGFLLWSVGNWLTEDLFMRWFKTRLTAPGARLFRR